MVSQTESHYGADAAGLICGFAFDAHGNVEVAETSAALQRIKSGISEGFIWLHFNLAHAASTKWLRDNLPLSELFHESLKDGSRSTRVEMDDDTLVAVVNDVHYDFSFEPNDISTLWISVSPNLVVSARIKPLRSIDRLREAVRRGEKLGSSVALLVHLMHDQEDVLVSIVRNITEKVDDIEDRLLAGRLATKRANLGSLRRLLVRLERLLAPEPAALFRLLRQPPSWVAESDLDDLRQSTEEFNVTLSDMAALRERIKLLQEEIAGRVAEANNRSLFVLTMVTVLALPINILTGMFGMNVGGIPWNDAPQGFFIVVTLIVFVTAIALAMVFRLRDKAD